LIKPDDSRSFPETATRRNPIRRNEAARLHASGDRCAAAGRSPARTGEDEKEASNRPCSRRVNALLKTALLLLAACLLCIAPWHSASASEGKSDPPKRKYRIAYLEGGPFWSFTELLDQTKKALARHGWLDRIEFPPELHLSPGWGSDAEAFKRLCRELLARKDVDLILSAGTDATLAFLEVNNGTIPIVGISISDPLKSKMVASEKDSGIDNFTTYFELDAYERLFRIFHMAVGFQRLGLLYSLAPNGKLYANFEEAHKIARERGFKVIEYGRIGAAETEEDCRAGIDWLLEQGVDALYIPTLNCFDYSLNPESSQRLLALLMEEKIPTFARDGTLGVRSGALMGLSNLNLASEGEFVADMIIHILQGEEPRSLPMVFRSPPSLSLNMYTADRIGYFPTFDVLTSCDVIFRQVSIAPSAPNR